MKKSKLIMACGTLILTAAAIFATKANKKFASITTVKFASPSFHIYGAGNILTTNNANGQTQLKLMIYTSTHKVIASGTDNLQGALTTLSGSPKVYFN